MTAADGAVKPPFEHVVESHGATVLRVARAILGLARTTEAAARRAASDGVARLRRTYPGADAEKEKEGVSHVSR
jgi:hypothetical protein